jgi:hypothetical protein
MLNVFPTAAIACCGFFSTSKPFRRGRPRTLHEHGLFLQRSGICENRAIDEGKAKIVEVINHIEAILSALDIQRRLDERGLAWANSPGALISDVKNISAIEISLAM